MMRKCGPCMNMSNMRVCIQHSVKIMYNINTCMIASGIGAERVRDW